MALILFDTNIFIDMLNGVHEATVELGNYDDPAISVITYMELHSGVVPHPQDKPVLDAVLAEFIVLQLEPLIVEHAISIRGKSLLTPPKNQASRLNHCGDRSVLSNTTHHSER